MGRREFSGWKILILWAVVLEALPAAVRRNPYQGYRVAVLRSRPGRDALPPLDQINASNFNDLEIAWRIKTDNFGDRPEYN